MLSLLKYIWHQETTTNIVWWGDGWLLVICNLTKKEKFLSFCKVRAYTHSVKHTMCICPFTRLSTDSKRPKITWNPAQHSFPLYVIIRCPFIPTRMSWCQPNSYLTASQYCPPSTTHPASEHCVKLLLSTEKCYNRNLLTDLQHNDRLWHAHCPNGNENHLERAYYPRTSH